jgi:hypothetical protein
MDHPAPLPAAGHWRAAALVAAGVAALELIVLLAVGAWAAAGLVGDGAHTPARATPAAEKPAGARPATARNGAPRAKLDRGETSVIVLNGNGQPGAASVGSERVRRLHYLVAGAGNAPRSDFARTLVMYRPAYAGEAVRLAADLGLSAKRAVPLDGVRARDLQGAHIALILGLG